MKLSDRLAGVAIAALKPVATVARDLIGIAGVLAVVHGIDQIYTPAAWIVGGLVLVAAAYGSARKKAA